MVKKYQLENIKDIVEMEEGNVKLILANENDLELIMAWRSHPKVYQFFKQQNGPLTWSEHFNFWNNRKNREDFIIEYHEGKKWRKVGSVNVSNLDTEDPEIGIMIGEITLQGKGVGSKATMLSLRYLKQRGYAKVFASIHRSNISSRKLFEKFDFIDKSKKNNSIWRSYLLENITI